MEHSVELRDAALAMFEAASRQDPSRIDRHTSSHAGVLMIGTDPEEWTRGGKRVAEESRQEMQESGTMEFSPGEVEAFVEGTVGWISARPVWTLADGGRVPARLTGVFHREGGEWKLVQGHVSVGVPNEELFGT
jgi:ketosteroid isomerase-like protein